MSNFGNFGQQEVRQEVNILYKENLFTSFGHLPVAENAETGNFWELPTLACSFWELPTFAVSGSCSFWELPTLAVSTLAVSGSCQLRQFLRVANFGSSGSCQLWQFLGVANFQLWQFLGVAKIGTRT